MLLNKKIDILGEEKLSDESFSSPKPPPLQRLLIKGGMNALGLAFNGSSVTLVTLVTLVYFFYSVDNSCKRTIHLVMVLVG